MSLVTAYTVETIAAPERVPCTTAANGLRLTPFVGLAVRSVSYPLD